VHVVVAASFSLALRLSLEIDILMNEKFDFKAELRGRKFIETMSSSEM
jgi:hypothetical protein